MHVRLHASSVCDIMVQSWCSFSGSVMLHLLSGNVTGLLFFLLVACDIADLTIPVSPISCVICVSSTGKCLCELNGQNVLVDGRVVMMADVHKGGGRHSICHTFKSYLLQMSGGLLLCGGFNEQKFG